MFYKFLSMLLCVCMLTGSVSNAAYAMGTTGNVQIEEVLLSGKEDAQAEEIAENMTVVETTDIVETGESAIEAGIDDVAIEETTAEENAKEIVTEEFVEKETIEVVPTQETVEEVTTDVINTEEMVEEVTVEAVETVEETITEVVSTEEMEEATTEVVMTEEMAMDREAGILGISENSAMVASADKELALDTEMTIKVGDYSKPTWLKYRVQKEGYYNLSLLYKNSVGEAYAFINDKAGMYEVYGYANANTEEQLMLYAESGDVLYYMTFAQSAGVAMTVTLSAVDSGEAVAGEDGDYTANAGDYTLTAVTKAESSIAEVEFWLTTDSDDLLTGERYRVKCCVEGQAVITVVGEGYHSRVNFGSVPPLKKNTLYNTQIILQDYESSKPIAVFDGIDFKTKDVDQLAIFRIDDITSDSVTVMYEALVGGFKGYAYYGQEGTTERNHVMSGTHSYEGLKSNTTYRIWCEDYEGNILVEETFKTLDITLDVSNASIECTGPSTAMIKVDVDAYGGDSSSLTLYFSYIDVDGRTCTNYNTVDVKEDENGIKSAELELEITDLLAETTYVIDAWIQEDSDPFSGKYHCFSEEITTPAGDFSAEDVYFFVSQSVYEPTSIAYTLTINNLSEVEWVDVYYRIKDATPDWAWNSYMAFTIGGTGTTYTDYIPDCNLGVEYEVKMVFREQGISVTGSCMMGENNYNPKVTADVDVFEANLTYSIPETEVTKEDEWTVSLGYIGKNRDDNFKIGNRQVINQENGYKVSVNPLKDYNVSLHPGEECYFIWQLYKNGVLCDVLKQSVTTKELTATFKQNSVGINETAYQVDISARKENLGSGVTFDVNVEGAGRVHKEVMRLTFDATGSATRMLKLNSLLPNTEYTVTLAYEEKAFATTQFTTKKDDRTLSNLKVTPAKDMLYVAGTLKGTISKSSEAHVFIYVREKGETLWGVGEQCCWIFDSKENFDIYIDNLKADTTYEYRIGIGNGELTSAEYLTQVHEGAATTLGDGRTLTQKLLNVYLHSFKMQFNVSGETSKSQKNYVIVYYRKKDSGDAWKKKYASVNGKGNVVISVDSGLEAETTYEYIYGLGNKSNVTKEELMNSKSGEFTTLGDDRQLHVDIVSYVDKADARLTLFGKAAENIETPVGFYYREKGSSSEHYYGTAFSGAETNVVKIDSLKETTEYEYIAGIGDSKENLQRTVSGNFITKEDDRKLTNVVSWVGYESVRIGATIINNSRRVDSCIHYFYREKGAEQWQHSFEWYGTSVTSEDSVKYEGLERDTEYEYVVVLANTEEIQSPDEITSENRHVAGSFKTKAGNYNFDIILNEEKRIHNQAVFDISASGEDGDDRLYVTLEFTDGENVVSKSVTLTQLLDYKNSFVLTGLNAATKYTLSALSFVVYENGNRIEIAKELPEVVFTTKEIAAPEKIEVPIETLYLNAAGGGEYISEQTVKAQVFPQEAEGTYIWTSSNENVAVVDNGHIQAVGAGSSVIKVASVSNPEIADTIEVIVKDYVIAEDNGLGIPSIVTETISCEEGESLSGYGLYERNQNGTLVKLEEITLSVEKSIVAKWTKSELTTESALTAVGVGVTEVYFESDGVKAVMDVTVLKKKMAFGLTGLSTDNEAYPAILNEDGKYEIARKAGVTYIVTGEIVPQQIFDSSLFKWTSSNNDVATVDNGVVTPVASGSVIITATPIDENSSFVQKESSIILEIKEVPETGNEIPSVYAIVNTKKNMVLEDVAFPKEWGEGWKWRNPKTPLYALPVNEECYAFEAYYTGDDLYAYEGLVNVYISSIDSVYAYEVDGGHNGVIEVSEKNAVVKDTIYLKLAEKHMGNLPLNYRFNLPSVDGLSVEYDEILDCYVVTAYKAGKYVMTPVMEFFETDPVTGDTYTTCKVSGSYSLKAVEDTQVAGIKIVSEDPSVAIDELNGQIRLDFTNEIKGKQITLSAKVTDQNSNKLLTPLKWKTTDKTVVSVSYDKKESHQATITVKGTGHAVLMVTASDATAYSTTLDLEIRDYKPRINTSKTTVNLAYDYGKAAGKELAYNTYGAVEITEVYGNHIESVCLKKADGNEETQLTLERYSTGQGTEEYIICPTKAEIPKKKYKCQLVVTMEGGDAIYSYPLNVTVVDKVPKVTAKMGTKMNLFYLTQNGNIIFKTGDGLVVEKVNWVDFSANEEGFSVGSSAYWDESAKGYRTVVSHENVKLINRKLADASIAKGVLTVKLQGVRNPIMFDNFKISYSYKKPSLKAKAETTNISPLTGNTTAKFSIYDSLKKENICYDVDGNDYNKYNEIIYISNNVRTVPEGSYVYTEYNGTKKQETVVYTLDSKAWREPLTVKQTIKVVEPKAALQKSILTYNKLYPGTVATSVLVGNISSVETMAWMDIEVIGDKKSNVLVENDILDFSYTENAVSPILITLNQTKLMELESDKELKAGTYKFKLIPYYRNRSTGEKVKCNSLFLKIKIVDKPVEVELKAKGSLDLTKSASSSITKDSICLETEFNNLGDNYQVIGAELKGEYSKYFKLSGNGESQAADNYYYLQIADTGKVKAGQKYKLSAEYTVQTEGGDIFKVESNVFTIKPKQSAPKISVKGNNQILYAAADISRYYTISVPDSYAIENISGGLDCNKDGKEDIVVNMFSVDGTSAVIKVYIADEHAVGTMAKGKTYSIPLAVKLIGRDGISKDAKSSIKVKVMC